MTILNHKSADMRFPATTRAELMGLRSELGRDRKGLRIVTDPELRRLIRRRITVTQFDIRAIEKGN
jgi:hypothetical protein